jgi:hypothetical protein
MLKTSEIEKRIKIVKTMFSEMSNIAFISKEQLEPNEQGFYYNSDDNMEAEYPDQNTKLQKCWEEIQRNLPPGYSIDANLLRHLAFNQAQDWFDISNYDIPKELDKIKRYLRRLPLFNYLNSLHPQVRRVSEIALSGDLEAALRTVYTSLDSDIRAYLKLKPADSTVNGIGQAFKDGRLNPSKKEHTESIRNFLQGVIGYYRSDLVHNALADDRNDIEASLSLFGLAHEAFTLFEGCIN